MTEIPSAVPPWPTSEPTAAELLRFAAGAGLHASAACWGVVEATRGHRDDPGGRIALKLSIEQMQHWHDLHLLLTALIELDESRADAVAARIWQAAEGGDSYGEWLWEWAEQHGHDAPAIGELGRAQGAASATTGDA